MDDYSLAHNIATLLFAVFLASVFWLASTAYLNHQWVDCVVYTEGPCGDPPPRYLR